MLDHAFTDAIAAVRRSLDSALLQRHAIDERLQIDVLLGDMTWETSYALPGEEVYAHVRGEITLDWPVWSQASYRSLCVGDPPEELPELLIEVTLRASPLASEPDPAKIVSVLNEESPALGDEALKRGPASVEHVFATDRTTFAFEVPYEGVYRFEEATVGEPEVLDRHFEPFGRWLASSLVRVADLPLDYLPFDPEEEPHL